jgi:hypothetical protein
VDAFSCSVARRIPVPDVDAIAERPEGGIEGLQWRLRCWVRRLQRALYEQLCTRFRQQPKASHNWMHRVQLVLAYDSLV